MSVGRSGGGGEPGGLRERKKRLMYRTVSDTAIALFLAKGFDQVPVAEVAAAAGISKPTLFRYFPAKEDLALHRFADHEEEAAEVVRAGRAAGRPPLEALHRHFLDALARHDPVTGLNDEPEVLEYHGLLYGTPSLVARLQAYLHRSEEALARALAEAAPDAAVAADPLPDGGLAARLAAGQITAVQRTLAERNWSRIHAGATADATLARATADADLGYRQLSRGLGRYS